MHKKTVLLIHPPQRGLMEGFSSGLISIANFLNNRVPGLDVRLVDLGLATAAEAVNVAVRLCEQAKEQLFVGCTTTSASYQAALSVMRAFKELRPDSISILGGHHASAQDDVIFRHHRDIVDFVIRGEGELAMLELINRYPHLADVPALSYWHSGALRRNLEAPLLESSELDSIGPTFQGSGLRSSPGKFDHVTYVSARGCPLRCSFCSVANQRIRAKGVPAIIDDIRFLANHFGYCRFAIEDNFFAHSPRRTLELCSALRDLQNEFSFQWDCQTRVESLQDKRVVDAMGGAGCEAVYLGVEALTPHFLRYLGKTALPEHYLHILEHLTIPNLLNSPVDCYINLQTGLPGLKGVNWPDDSLHIMARLGRLASAHGKLITVFPQLNVIYPGTQHFQMAIANRWLGPLGEDVFEHFTAWEVEQEPILKWLGQQFAHGVGGIPLGILDLHLLQTQGEFRVDDAKVAAIIGYLETLAKLDGILIFEYGRYITPFADGIKREAWPAKLPQPHLEHSVWSIP